MHKKRNFRHGEIGAILSFISLILVTTGVIIGSRGAAIQHTKSLLGFAQSPCTYSYTLELRDPITNIILSDKSGFQWANDLPVGSTIASSSRPFTSTGLVRVTWNPSPLPSDLVNRSVSVSLNAIPKGYRIQTSEEGDIFYCRSNKSDYSKACQTMKLDPANPLKLNNIALTCGDNFTYGWYIIADSKAPGIIPPTTTTVPNPTQTPAPTIATKTVCETPKSSGGKGGICRTTCKYPNETVIGFFGCKGPTGNCCEPVVTPTIAPHPTYSVGANVCELKKELGGKGGTCQAKCIPGDQSNIGDFGCSSNKTKPACCVDNKIMPTVSPKETITGSVLSPTPTQSPFIYQISHSQGKYKILFVPEIENTKADMDAFIQKFIPTLEKSNLGSIVSDLNFLGLDISYELNCTVNLDKSLTCDRKMARSIAADLRSQYGVDEVVFVTNKNLEPLTSFTLKVTYVDQTGTIYDSDYEDAVLMGYNMPVGTLHELGHAIGNLQDEYLIKNKTSDQVPPFEINCTADTTCHTWRSLYGSQITCDEICGLQNRHRPVSVSIMDMLTRDKDGIIIAKSFDFNKPSLAAWDKKFGTNLATQTTINEYKRKRLTLHVSISQTTSGSAKIEKAELINRYPVGDISSVTGAQSIKILGQSGAPLYQQALSQYAYDVHDGSKTFLSNLDLYLPYFDTMDSIVVTSKGKTVASLSVKNLLTSSKDVIKRAQSISSCGNNMCEAEIGETPSSCAQDCTKVKTKYDKILDLYSCDIDGNGTVNTLDFIALQKKYGTKQTLEGIRADVNHDGHVDAQDSSLVTQYLGTNTK